MRPTGNLLVIVKKGYKEEDNGQVWRLLVQFSQLYIWLN